MTPEDAPKISDQIMTALLKVFQSTSGKAGWVQEDALIAMSMLIKGLWLIAPYELHIRFLL